MDEIKHVYTERGYDGCGWGAGGVAAAAVAFLAVGGLAVWAGSRRNDEGARYMAAKSQGLQEAGIACNTAGINEIKCQLSQMQQNQFYAATTAAATAAVINSQNVNQQKTDAGLAVLANQNAVINSTINSALGNRFVWCKPICETTTTGTAAAAA